MPASLGGKQAAVRLALARPRHHVCHAIPPGQVVRGLFVRSGGFWRVIRLVKDEFGWLAGILEDIETAVAGLTYRGFVVQPAGFDEGRDVLGADPNMDERYMHADFLR
jgi:hypothetical protein